MKSVLLSEIVVTMDVRLHFDTVAKAAHNFEALPKPASCADAVKSVPPNIEGAVMGLETSIMREDHVVINPVCCLGGSVHFVPWCAFLLEAVTWGAVLNESMTPW